MAERQLCATVVGGDDMSPSIRPGERLRITPAASDRIVAGDVIVFKRHVLIAHRVMGAARAFGRTYFITRGDRCPYIDSPVSEDLVAGIIIGKRLRLVTSLRQRVALTGVVLWYIAAVRVLRGRAFRIANSFARRVASYGLPEMPAA
uniref:Signal peptidase I n=1 Tax=Candidatus Methanomethylicus mesodigestus TaxID=1867258 RepID=A0A7C3F2C9_9CREN